MGARRPEVSNRGTRPLFVVLSSDRKSVSCRNPQENRGSRTGYMSLPPWVYDVKAKPIECTGENSPLVAS